MKKVIFTLLLLFPVYVFSQPYFYRYDGLQVSINNTTLKHPWVGGLNFIQASNVDLNLDGTNDLVLFDRSGNKLRTFIRNTTVSTIDYTYAPQYQNKFPEMEQWVLLHDYNCDGKADIFTFSSYSGASGIRVYKNSSNATTGLQFTLVKNIITSKYYPNQNPIGLYVSIQDIPALADIDNDGDTDIITFVIGGGFLEYHKNQSKELYGVCDSLIFEVKNHCWGYASENPFNNQFKLFDTCLSNVPNPEMVSDDNDNAEPKRDPGSCSMCIDIDGDGDKDYITGDIGFKNLTLLKNGGTTTASSFVSVDYAFPSNNNSTAPVNLNVFPCGFYVDINNDGKKDLLVSPNTSSAAENLNSMVYYENTGANNLPIFNYKQNNLFQDNMIDVGEGAYPALFDYNNDGLLDLFIGNYGYYASPVYSNKIAYFKNTGTALTPQFDLITDDFNNMSSLALANLIPTFGDMDNDGDGDMIVGDYNGYLHYFENTAATGMQAVFSNTPTINNMKNSNNRTINIGTCAAPHIADIDGDGKKDLVIGARNGKLAYYKKLNTTGLPQLDSVSHYWGNIKVNQPLFVTGYSYPFVFKQGGKTELLVGSQLGYLRRYDNIDGNLNGTFHLVDSTFINIREGARTAPTGGDINNDGLWDLFVGNYSGGVSFYKGSATEVYENVNQIKWSFEIYPNPANESVTIKINNIENKKFKIEIYSVLGSLINSYSIHDSVIQIPVHQLSKGMYIVNVFEINSGEKTVSTRQAQRLIITH